MTRRELFQGVIAGVASVWGTRSPVLRFKGIPIPFDDVYHWTYAWKSCPSPPHTHERYDGSHTHLLPPILILGGFRTGRKYRPLNLIHLFKG